jgi:ABC-type branched-subunit amino acid transport system substrate-binding protein
LPDAGRGFLARAFPGRAAADLGSETVGAADAALVALAAIGASDGTAAGVTTQVLQGRVDGLAGRYAFDANGDPTLEPVGVYRITRRAPRTPHRGVQGIALERVIDARPELVAP